MKIEKKITYSTIFNIGLLLMIGLFAIQNMNLVLTKLRFAEIADDLNASFLEMRLAEKNYFLYGDKEALPELEERITGAVQILNSVRADIIRATGKDNLDQLESYLKKYSSAVEEMKKTKAHDMNSEARLRAQGRELREFSDKLTRLERIKVNEILLNSKYLLLFSLFGVLFFALTVSHYVSKSIVRPIKDIEKLARTISGGDFKVIDNAIPEDEMGSVIKAMNQMSQQLKLREEEIIQSKKLASLGVLVAGVAHEINNPLNNISMIAQTYNENYAAITPWQRLEFMDKIQGETERIKDIVKNLLDFSKPKAPDLRETDMNETVRKTLKLVQNMLDVSNVNTNLNLANGLPPVLIDEQQIQQVFVNLIINAIQATQKDGKLVISTRAGKEPGTVEITFWDNGKGISPEFLPHIFDPFFSTKEQGGTGLGLWVSYGILKNHGGTIRVESKVGTGTVFTVQLPALKK